MEQTRELLTWHIPEISVSYTRVHNTPYPEIKTSKDVYSLFLHSWDTNTIELQEHFKVIFLNRAKRAFGMYCLSVGGITGTVVDIRLLFGIALKAAAISIIVVHNHPSGNITPSTNDKILTSRIVEAGKLLEITVLDHLIITPSAYYSFADEGQL